jgi:hypothetical protein
MKKIVLLFASLIPSLSFAQNVGIGTANPLMRLHVVKDDSAVALLDNTQSLNAGVSTALYFKTGTGITPYTGGIKTIGEASSSARLGLFTYATGNPNSLKERLSITDGGAVGIGTTTPQTLLHLNPNGAGSLLIGSNRSAGGYTNLEMGISTLSNGYGYVQATKASGTSYGNLILNAHGGNVGIGTTAPTTSLDVRGGIALPIKTVTADYVVAPDDYTIVVDMQNSLAHNIDITLPGQYTNTGRIIKVVAVNLANRGGTIYNEGVSPYGKVELFSGITPIEHLGYNGWTEIHESVSGNKVHTEYYNGTFSLTLQCTGTALGWIVTDKIERFDYYEDVHD